ncbi:MAG: hypothetical protein IT368_17760, partial [Candidatus Hydrogenedentes bacterium]|nr:hypothetical protein [Candidatus Hydrogenedentota bacterium]
TPSHENWAYLLPGQDLIQRTYPATSNGLALMFAVAALGGIAVAWRRNRRQRVPESGTVDSPTLPWLLFLVALLPAPLIAILSQVLEPMPMPRYTLFSTAGLYVLAAGAVAALPRPWLRSLGATVICALLGWQLLWLMPAGARTEFYSATAYVANQRAPEDPVLTTLSPDVFYIHFPIKVDLDLATPSLLGFHTQGPVPYKPKHTMRGVASEAFRYFQALPRAARQTRAVWVIVMRLYEYGAVPLLEDELARRNLAFEARHWYAYEGISVYRITAPNPLPATAAPEMPIDWAAFLNAHGVVLPDGQSPEKAASTLNACLDRRPDPFGSASEFASLAFIVASSDLAFARNIADAGIQAHPDHGGLFVARAYIRLALGDVPGGQADAARARDLLPRNAIRAYGYILSATVAGDFAAAQAAFRRLNRLSGGHLQAVIEQGLAAQGGAGVQP